MKFDYILNWYCERGERETECPSLLHDRIFGIAIGSIHSSSTSKRLQPLWRAEALGWAWEILSSYGSVIVPHRPAVNLVTLTIGALLHSDSKSQSSSNALTLGGGNALWRERSFKRVDRKSYSHIWAIFHHFLSHYLSSSVKHTLHMKSQQKPSEAVKK